MKKTILILVSFIGLLGCRNTDSIHLGFAQEGIRSQSDEEKPPCKSLDDYKLIDPTDYSSQTNWLREHGENICGGKTELYKYLYPQHTITEVDFNTRLLSAANKKATAKTWKQIDSLISKYKDYEKYVAFDIDHTGKIDLKLIDNFVISPSCYSIALFRKIQIEHQLTATKSDIYFEFYQVKPEEVIFRMVKKSGDPSKPPQLKPLSFHNISTNPLMVKDFFKTNETNIKKRDLKTEKISEIKTLKDK